jgi:hypothetical protein
MDFILEMYLKDNPDAYMLRRGAEPDKLTQAEVMAEWERKLTGKAKMQYLGVSLPSAAVLKRMREMGSAAEFLRQTASAQAQAREK